LDFCSESFFFFLDFCLLGLQLSLEGVDFFYLFFHALVLLHVFVLSYPFEVIGLHLYGIVQIDNATFVVGRVGST
jgi:hypothetical protein